MICDGKLIIPGVKHGEGGIMLHRSKLFISWDSELVNKKSYKHD